MQDSGKFWKQKGLDSTFPFASSLQAGYPPQTNVEIQKRMPMGLQIYNTRTKRVEPFEPFEPETRRVGMYCCGPTVYDYGHIGNFRTFVFADLVRRYLEFRGYKVCYVMNITDVEDKIIRRVRETGLSLREYTGKYEQAFWEDAAQLNILEPHHKPRATEHIQEIIDLIRRLEERGFAYKAADGSVYFSIERYQQAGYRYGQLVNIKPDQLLAGVRIRTDEYAKDSVADFALWKAYDPEDGDIWWDSPWGRGRPGWHIECSAMSMKYLGPSFELHLGGEDLIFPHHEDEIAQSEGAGLQPPGRPFVKYWMHAAYLQVEGKKMSKSLGNFYTLRDLLAKGYSGRQIRYLLLSAHYRDPLNFTFAGLQAAGSALGRIDECLDRLQETAGEQANRVDEPDPKLIEEFTRAMDDDLNVSAGWAVVFEWIREQNRKMDQGQMDPTAAARALRAWEQIDRVWGIGRKPQIQPPPEILALVEERQQARKARDFARADAIRDEILRRGWKVEDTPKGPRLKPVQPKA